MSHRTRLVMLSSLLLALAASSTPAQVAPSRPLPTDQLGFEFGPAKLSKIYGLDWIAYGLTMDEEGFSYERSTYGCVFTASGPEAGAYAVSPMVGEGAFSAEVSLGILGLTGVVEGYTEGGLKVDLEGSSPEVFWFLSVHWSQGQLWAQAKSELGVLAAPVALGTEHFAVLRMIQTETDLSFYARPKTSSTWTLVHTQTNAPWAGRYQVGFGAQHFEDGGRVAFDHVRVWGDGLFGAQTQQHVGMLAMQHEALDTVMHALMLTDDMALARFTLTHLLLNVVQTQQSIMQTVAAGQFDEFVLHKNALKFLAKASKYGAKAESYLNRDELVSALQQLGLLRDQLLLADLAIRGMAVKRSTDLALFQPFEITPITTVR
ncbi:MAG: hypothetical protein H6833_10900 [Planctomycetes bacterium]|nr:hypothetical protein [Planctomycetota bacterium]